MGDLIPPKVLVDSPEWTRLIRLAWLSDDPALVQAADQAVASAVTVVAEPVEIHASPTGSAPASA